MLRTRERPITNDGTTMARSTGNGGEPNADKRTDARRGVTIPATILCPDGQAIPCVLRDMSAEGAKLSVSRRHRLPATFAIAVPGRADAYPVRRLWQHADAAGIALDLPRPGGEAGA